MFVDADDPTEGYTFPFLTVNWSSNISTVTVSVDNGTVVSTLKSVGHVEGVEEIQDNEGDVLVWAFTTAGPQVSAQVQEYLRKYVTVKPTNVEGAKVSVVVDSNTTSGFENLPDNAKIVYNPDNGQYYMYVPYANAYSGAVTWTDAVNASKGYVLAGMRGYLTNTTNKSEYTFVNKITGDAPVWAGATSLVNKDGNKIAVNEEGTDLNHTSFKYGEFLKNAITTAASDGRQPRLAEAI